MSCLSWFRRLIGTTRQRWYRWGARSDTQMRISLSVHRMPGSTRCSPQAPDRGPRGDVFLPDRRSSMPTTLWPSRCAVGLTQTPPSSARFALAVGITRDYYHKRRSTGKSPLPTPANRCLCLPRVGAWCGVVLVTDGAGNRQLNGAHQLRETTLGAACGPWHARERAPRRRSVSLAPTLGVDLE